MAGVDERIRSEMERLTRPATGELEEIARRRDRRRVLRRVQSGLVAVAVLGVTAVGVLGLVRAFEGPSTGPAGSVSPSVGGTGGEEPGGLCDESFLRADTDGDGNLDEVFVFSLGQERWVNRHEGVVDCDGPDVGQRYVLHVSGNKIPAEGGPGSGYGVEQDLPECTEPGQCRLLAAPDIDQDGADELAIQVARDGNTASVVIYRLEADPARGRYELVRVSIAEPGDPEHGLAPGPATFQFSVAGLPLHAFGCFGDQNHLRVVITDGALTDPKDHRGTVHEAEFRPQGSMLVPLRTTDLDDVVFGGRILENGRRTLCGAPLAGG